MTTLTPTQIELLKNEDVKAVAEAYLKYLDERSDVPFYSFEDFKSQFTVEPEWKILEYKSSQKYLSIKIIHSVQYKSEIPLTVGDDTNKGKILRFEVYGDNLKVWIKHPNRSEQWSFISEVKKIERKLRFVTNGDGEEIFDNDIYCFVDRNFNLYPYNICGFQGGNIGSQPDEVTYFKSKEKATEYILLNSPKLSVNEVMKCYSLIAPLGSQIANELQLRITELIKSKQ